MELRRSHPLNSVKSPQRGCDFLHVVFVVPPLGGIEAEQSCKIPVKTGTTNGAISSMNACRKKITT